MQANIDLRRTNNSMTSCSIILHKFFFYLIDKQKNFEDTKGFISSRESKSDRQHIYKKNYTEY
jgi:hypothetical protein